MIINLRLLALCALPILVAGTEAIADDAKTYPGVMCQTQLSTVEAVSRSPDNGQMLNVGGGPTQIWTCPIVRDTMAEDTGEFAAISVGANTRVECTLETRSFRGTNPVSIPPDDPNPTTIIDNTIRFTYALGDDNFKGEENGIYYFRCRVPLGGFVASYTLEEDD
jgi:hypothetical protein